MLELDTDGDFREELEAEGCLSRDLGLALAYRDCWELPGPAPPDPPPTGTGLKAELL